MITIIELLIYLLLGTNNFITFRETLTVTFMNLNTGFNELSSIKKVRHKLLQLNKTYLIINGHAVM